ncbi:cytoplasmic protein [Candidatus Poribacteria bacterium]|nr:MAG: cytoplasmic protein [Candidatus Poribacteria bacterium]
MDKLSRREFLRRAALGGLALYASPVLGKAFAEGVPDLAVAEGDDPKQLVRKAVEALGGMKRFVKRGDVVFVKPNIAWNRKPELAATTNPEVVEEIVRMCLEAGAKEVRVFDITIQPARLTYRRSGIMKAVKRAGGKMIYVDERKIKEVAIPEGESVKSWPMYTEALEADVLINVPIAKHHSAARLTMAIKNLMGVLGGERGALHRNLHQNLADIATRIRPHLNILDAYRILVNHGPTGGRPEDVKLARKVIAGVDIVAVDSLGATLFGLKGEELGYVRNAHRMGLGEMDLGKLRVKTVKV